MRGFRESAISAKHSDIWQCMVSGSGESIITKPLMTLSITRHQAIFSRTAGLVDRDRPDSCHSHKRPLGTVNLGSFNRRAFWPRRWLLRRLEAMLMRPIRRSWQLHMQKLRAQHDALRANAAVRPHCPPDHNRHAGRKVVRRSASELRIFAVTQQCAAADNLFRGRSRLDVPRKLHG